jgi:hypothetical protein
MIPRDIHVPITLVINIHHNANFTNSYELRYLNGFASFIWLCHQISDGAYLFVSSVLSRFRLTSFFYLEVSLKFHGFHVLLRGSTFATMAGPVSSYESSLELLLALKPPPPTFGVILLGLGAPGLQEVSVYSV